MERRSHVNRKETMWERNTGYRLQPSGCGLNDGERLDRLERLRSNDGG